MCSKLPATTAQRVNTVTELIQMKMELDAHQASTVRQEPLTATNTPAQEAPIILDMIWSAQMSAPIAKKAFTALTKVRLVHPSKLLPGTTVETLMAMTNLILICALRQLIAH